MNYTSIEQSKKLLELGLSPKSADMEYKCVGFTMHTNRPTDEFKYKLMPKEVDIPHKAKYDIPCWSVGALLELMPLPRLEKDVFPISEQKNFEEKFGWECITYGDNAMSLCEQWSSTKIDVCYKMVVWLLENNYIKH